MAFKHSSWLPVLALLLFTSSAHAFGAGNIASTSKIEGQNWRHGDIEDTFLLLLTARAMGGKQFSKMDVKRIYFGNWLRDYSQAIDVGTVKYVSAEAIRLLLWVLGFMSFGYGTGEFEVTRERLGCYRPEEHIDNPKDYADNVDARQYDRRLRGPVDERRELSIDERTGLKHYIASENQDITTSAGMIRRLFGRSIELGRRYKHSNDPRDFYEALRLLGTGCHCLEDYSAHSNYTELALIELGERDIFPHVGRRTQIRLQGAQHPVFPVVTGTFGGVDFLHSVMGEFSDKAAQSELQELEGAIQQSQNADTSLLKELLDKLPPGLLGDSDHKGKADELQANAQAAQMQNMHISPKEPEAFTQQMEEVSKQIYPILEFHDNIVKSISEAIEKIPVLPDLVEEVQNQVSIFVFSLLAPFVVPIINQVKNELRTGSSEIIQSSKDKQLIVFRDDNSTDPTHSMLSKDHFSNVLNEPAGKIASQVLKWVVPQIVACWDDDSIDIRRTNDRIINGIFHHPALRDYGNDGAVDGRRAMFGVVQQWWGELSDRERNDLRRKLSRDGVQNGQNHREGVHDTGHGCCKPLGLPTIGTAPSSGAIGGVLGGLNQALGGSSSSQSGRMQSQVSSTIGEAVGGGALGSIVGGIAGTVGAGLLGGAFGGDDSDKKTYQSSSSYNDGSYSTRITETGHRPQGQQQEERYGQAQMSETQYSSGGYREDFQRYEQGGRQGNTGYGFQETHEVRPSHDGGYQERTERRFEHTGCRYESEVHEQYVSSSHQSYQHHESHSGYKKKNDSDDDDDDSNDDDDWEKKQRKQRKKEEKRLKKMRLEEEEQQRRDDHGGRRRSGSRERRGSNDHKRQSGGFGAHGGSSGGRGGDTYSSSQQYSSDGRYESQTSYRQPSTYEQSSYGGDSASFGGGRSEYQQQHRTSGGESGGYGSSGFGGGRNEYPRQQQSYGGDSYGGGGYAQPQRQEYRDESYGRPPREEFGAGGGQRNDEDEYRRRENEMPGGFRGSGGGEYGERSGYDDGYGDAGGYGRRY